jgi:NAD(P)-dependent dehydrogenase (short-subunit alcohol dehydrogenase family)
LIERYPQSFHAEVLEMTDPAAIRAVVERSFAQRGRIGVLISNAGYGLFGAAEELTDEQVEHLVATNLVGTIYFIRAALPHLRAQGGGRVIQIAKEGRLPLRPRRHLPHHPHQSPLLVTKPGQLA